MRKAISLDIGGTNLRCALINENYEIEKVIINNTSNSTVEVFLGQVEEIINEVGITDDVVAISMGVPGRVRWDGFVFELPNVGIKSIPLAEFINDKFHKTAYVKNDAVMAALAEGCLGEGKDYDASYFITISTGIGGALVRDGKIVVPSDEIGHTLIKYNDQYYEFEKLNSGRYLVDLCAMNELYVLDAREFFQLKAQGNEKALEVYNIWLNNLTNLFQFVRKYFDAKIIILSGGVLKSKDYFLDDLIAKNPNIKIALAKFDQTAGLIGAAYYSFNPQ
jgi:glucokinase